MSEFLSFGAWALFGVIAFIATTFLVSSRWQWIVLSAVWTTAATALLLLVFGGGHYRSVASFIGDVATDVVVVLSIVVPVSVGMWLARSTARAPAWRVVGGLVGGLIGIPLSQMTGLLAACSFTGDCI